MEIAQSRSGSKLFHCPLGLVGLMVGLGSIAIAAAQGGIKDTRQLEKEIRIMESILSTSLDFLAQETLGSSPRERFPLAGEGTIRSTYLANQGVIFQISVPSGPLLETAEFEESGLAEAADEGLVEAQLALSEAQLAQSMAEVRAAQHRVQARIAGTGDYYAQAPPAPPPPPSAPEPPPAPEAPPAPEPSSGVFRQDVEREMARVRREMARMRERTKAAGEQVEKYRAQLDETLLDVLARHGGSLTQLPGSEHLNFIFTQGFDFEGSFFSQARGDDEDSSSRSSAKDKWTVKMSDVREFSAGRLTREQFAVRILKY